MEQFEGYKIREVHDIDKWWNTCNNLVIVRGGRTCVHSYLGGDQSDMEVWRQNVLMSFFADAFNGSGDKESFMREHEGWSDAADLWKHFRRSYEGLKRLNPEGYQESMKIGETWLKLQTM